MIGATHLYAIALGSNRPHGRHGRPGGVIGVAIARLDQDFGLFDASPIMLNPAHGGAGRRLAGCSGTRQLPRGGRAAASGQDDLLGQDERGRTELATVMRQTTHTEDNALCQRCLLNGLVVLLNELMVRR